MYYDNRMRDISTANKTIRDIKTSAILNITKINYIINKQRIKHHKVNDKIINFFDLIMDCEYLTLPQKLALSSCCRMARVSFTQNKSHILNIQDNKRMVEPFSNLKIQHGSCLTYDLSNVDKLDMLTICGDISRGLREKLENIVIDTIRLLDEPARHESYKLLKNVRNIQVEQFNLQITPTQYIQHAEHITILECRGRIKTYLDDIPAKHITIQGIKNIKMDGHKNVTLNKVNNNDIKILDILCSSNWVNIVNCNIKQCNMNIRRAKDITIIDSVFKTMKINSNIPIYPHKFYINQDVKSKSIRFHVYAKSEIIRYDNLVNTNKTMQSFCQALTESKVSGLPTETPRTKKESTIQKLGIIGSDVYLEVFSVLYPLELIECDDITLVLDNPIEKHKDIHKSISNVKLKTSANNIYVEFNGCVWEYSINEFIKVKKEKTATIIKYMHNP